MTITAQSAEQIIKLLKQKVVAGTLDRDTAEHLAVLALQEVQVADETAEGAGTTDDGGGEEDLVPPEDDVPAEPETPAGAPVIDASAQILSLVSQFDQGTASLWTTVKGKIEEVLKGAQGAAFPLGTFSSNAKTAEKGNRTQVSIEKGKTGNGVNVDFQFKREWDVPGLSVPDTVAASVVDDKTCHLPLRKELLALAQDISDITDSELTWQRSRFPEKTVAFLTAEATKANDARVVEALAAAPKSIDRAAWRQWSITAQVHVLGTDYTSKSFTDLMKEVKES